MSYLIAAVVSAFLFIAVSAQQCSHDTNTDFNFNDDHGSQPANSHRDCCRLCANRPGCDGYSYFQGVCYFKKKPFTKKHADGVTSGALTSRPKPPTPPTPGGNFRQGKITVYSPDVGGGACGFNTGHHLSAAAKSRFFAIASDQWKSGLGCGQCMRVRRGGKEATMMATNLCPECNNGHQDLSNDAFRQLTGSHTGVYAMEYQFIRCPDEFVRGDIQIFMKEGSNNWWAAFQPRNMKQPVSGMQISLNMGAWKQLPVNVVEGLYFVSTDFMGGPYRLKIQTHGRPDIITDLKGVQEKKTITVRGQQN